MSMSSSLEYEQLVAKTKTKGKVWEHFGFPTDATSAIIDNKKIVCKQYKAVIAYLGKHFKPDVSASASASGAARQARRQQQQVETADSLGGTIAQAAPHHCDSTKHKQLVKANALYIVLIML